MTGLVHDDRAHTQSAVGISPPGPPGRSGRSGRSGRWWEGVTVVSAVVLGASFVAAGHYRAHVRFSADRSIAATTALALFAGAGIVVGLLGRRRPVQGLVGGAAICAAMSVCWLLLGDHRLDGPVLLTVAREHGVRLGDFLAFVPAAMAALLGLAAMVAVSPRRRQLGRS